MSYKPISVKLFIYFLIPRDEQILRVVLGLDTWLSTSVIISIVILKYVKLR